MVEDLYNELQPGFRDACCVGHQRKAGAESLQGIWLQVSRMNPEGYIGCRLRLFLAHTVRFTVK